MFFLQTASRWQRQASAVGAPRRCAQATARLLRRTPLLFKVRPPPPLLVVIVLIVDLVLIVLMVVRIYTVWLPRRGHYVMP